MNETFPKLSDADLAVDLENDSVCELQRTLVPQETPDSVDLKAGDVLKSGPQVSLRCDSAHREMLRQPFGRGE